MRYLLKVNKLILAIVGGFGSLSGRSIHLVLLGEGMPSVTPIFSEPFSDPHDSLDGISKMEALYSQSISNILFIFTINCIIFTHL